jgi:hypothetical protein
MDSRHDHGHCYSRSQPVFVRHHYHHSPLISTRDDLHIVSDWLNFFSATSNTILSSSVTSLYNLSHSPWVMVLQRSCLISRSLAPSFLPVPSPSLSRNMCLSRSWPPLGTQLTLRTLLLCNVCSTTSNGVLPVGVSILSHPPWAAIGLPWTFVCSDD